MECCPFPKNDEVKDDPDCKHHLEGIEKKEKKDQHKASSCFAECIFKKNELLNDKNELDKEKLKNGIGDYLEKNNAADFKAISLESIDLCITECKKKLSDEWKLNYANFNSTVEAKKEKFEKWAAEHNKTGEGHHGGHNKDGEKKCSFYPEMVLKCMVGNVVRVSKFSFLFPEGVCKIQTSFKSFQVFLIYFIVFLKVTTFFSLYRAARHQNGKPVSIRRICFNGIQILFNFSSLPL